MDNNRRGSRNPAASEPGSPAAPPRDKAAKEPKQLTGASNVVKRGKAGTKASWEFLEDRLGGKEGVLEAALGSQSDKAKMLTEMILDKAYSGWSVQAMAKRAGMSIAEFADLFRDTKWLETLVALHDELPEIARDAAIDARSARVMCPRCGGTKIFEKSECNFCDVDGSVRKSGDKDARNWVGEAVGLVKKGGPAVQTNIQVNNLPAQTTSFEELMKRASKAMEIRQLPPIIDVESEDE